MLIGDCAFPLTAAKYPTRYADQDIVGWGFYVGGDTPHVWSLAEVAVLKTKYRYLLPIFTRSNPAGVDQAAADAAAALEQLHALGAPRGTVLQLDLETAVNAAYVEAFNTAMVAGGYLVELYGSASTVVRNPRPSAGYNEARWTGADYAPADLADQFADEGDFDLNDFRPGAPLWDTRPPAVTPESEDDVTTYFPIQVMPDPSGNPNGAGIATWPAGGVHVVQLVADPGKWGDTEGTFRLAFILTSGPDVVTEHVATGAESSVAIELADVPGLVKANCRGVSITRPDGKHWPWGGGGTQ